jgi:ubiquilin
MLSQMEAMLSNPAMGPMMRSMMSDPTVIRQMLDSDPALRAMAEANPGMREMLQNPDVLRRMSDPETLRTNLRMMQQMQSMGMGLPGLGGAPAGGFGGGFGGGAAASATPPEELYASQLAQMKDMGFFDEAQNIRVLQQCMGNVSAAIERLLAGP